VTDEERLTAFLRDVLPPVGTAGPSRDLWPAIAKGRPPGQWSWVDLSLAGALCAVCIWQPAWFVWLAYHL
jgi:hypothetical protein